MTRHDLARIACACALAAAATSARAESFTSLTVFGDSLSDTGNLFAITSEFGDPMPKSPPYFEGRFSNGPIWADTLADSFDAKGLVAQNFAFGGARALPDGVPPPDLPEQLGLFALTGSPDLGDRPVASLFIGANDINAAVGTAGLDAVAMAAADAVTGAALALSAFGFEDFLIFNLPDLGATPRFNLFAPDFAPSASAATVIFNDTLASGIDALRRTGLGVIDVDLFTLFEDLVADPTFYGVTDTTLPCLFLDAKLADRFDQPQLCGGADQAGRAFFDGIHPNYVIHEQIAGIVSAQVAPVPLPASALLLFAGIAGLVAVRRRL